MRLLDLFSGIGGFALAAEWVWGNELEIVSFVEKDEYCRKVLNKHWPAVPIMEDVRDVKKETMADAESIRYSGSLQTLSTEKRRGTTELGLSSQIRRIDLITGGFPCQPFSQAGKRGGRSDDRHLWPEMLRIIQLFRPAWVVAENVRGLLSIEDGVVFEQVCTDLEDSGFEVQSFIIPAVAVDAHHRRDRVWFVAHTRCGEQQERSDAQQVPTKRDSQEGSTDSSSRSSIKSRNVSNSTGDRQWRERKKSETQKGLQSRPEHNGKLESRPEGCREVVAYTNKTGSQDRQGHEAQRIQRRSTNGSDRSRWLPEPDVGRVAHGVPSRVDRLKSLGNAIVPQVAEHIFRAIESQWKGCDAT